MNSKRTTLLAAAAAVGLTTTLLGATASFAQDAAPTDTQKAERTAMHEEMKTFHDSIESTMKSGDFAAWKEQMLAQNQKMKDQADAQVTQENFDTLKKASELKEAGKNDEARELMKSSGMRGPGMMMHGEKPGKPDGEHRGARGGEHRDKVERPAEAPAAAQK